MSLSCCVFGRLQKRPVGGWGCMRTSAWPCEAEPDPLNDTEQVRLFLLEVAVVFVVSKLFSYGSCQSLVQLFNVSCYHNYNNNNICFFLFVCFLRVFFFIC